MIDRKLSSLPAAGAVSVSVACVVLLVGAGSALACVSDIDGDCFRPNYHIQRTDGSLAAWSGAGTGRIVDCIKNNVDGLRNQYECHQVFVAVRSPRKPSWNLDE